MGDQSPLSLNPVVWAKIKKRPEDEKAHNRNSQIGQSTPPAPVLSDGNSLHDALEALAIRHERERNFKRAPRISGSMTSTLSGAVAANSTTTTSSNSSGVHVALPAS